MTVLMADREMFLMYEKIEKKGYFSGLMVSIFL